MGYGITEASLPGRKCRVATGNFKARKGFAALVPFLLALALAVSGCGRQDRYEITAPPLTSAALPAEWAHFTEIPVPALGGSNVLALAGWSAEDYLLALGGTAVYRVQNGLFTNLPWPGARTVTALLLASDDVMWGLDSGGQLCRLEQDAWLPVEDILPEGYGLVGLLEDDLGRLVAYGADGLLLRREEGVWVERHIDPQEDLRDGWAAPGQGAFLVSSRGTVFRMTATGPDTLTVLPDVYQSSIQITGDGQGALVVCARYDGTWLLEGESWTDIGEDTRFLNAFWLDGLLLGLGPFPEDIMGWDGAAWQFWAPCPFDEHMNLALSAPMAQGWLVSLDSGAILTLTGQEAVTLAPPLGRVAGVARFQGLTHLLMNEGTHFTAEDGGWRRQGRGWTGDNAVAGYPLVVDEDGRLLMVGTRNLAWWDGQDYALASIPGNYWNRALPQPDGSLCLSGSSKWGVVRHGAYFPFADLPGTWDTVVGAVLDGNGSGWAADGQRLGRADAGALTTDLLMQGWQVTGLIRDADGRLLVYGTGRVLRQDGVGWEDITPRMSGQANLRVMGPDGLGGLLGLDSYNGVLLHLDQEGWTFQPFPPLGFSWSSLGFIANDDGTYLMTGFEHSIQRLERVVWP